MIVLLDLINTLVNRAYERNARPVSTRDQVKVETYREWLLEFVKPHRVFLVTARPAVHREATLARIDATCDGWQPHRAYFNENDEAPPVFKEGVLAALRRRFSDETFLAIESNARTREMYVRNGVPCLMVAPENISRKWSDLRADLDKLGQIEMPGMFDGQGHE